MIVGINKLLESIYKNSSINYRGLSFDRLTKIVNLKPLEDIVRRIIETNNKEEENKRLRVIIDIKIDKYNIGQKVCTKGYFHLDGGCKNPNIRKNIYYIYCLGDCRTEFIKFRNIYSRVSLKTNKILRDNVFNNKQLNIEEMSEGIWYKYSEEDWHRGPSIPFVYKEPVWRLWVRVTFSDYINYERNI